MSILFLNPFYFLKNHEPEPEMWHSAQLIIA
jgi:hypothetical protein